MAFPAATFTTYHTTANDRDVSDFVTNVSPKDSPFFSMISANTGMARKKENVQDALTAPNGTNTLVEGDELTNVALADRTFEDNWMQIFKKVFGVSGTQEAVSKYGGIKSEIQYQLKNKYKELATDVEYEFIQGTSASGATGTARTLSGLVEKITTNTATTAITGSTWTATSAAELYAFEELLNDMFDQMFETGIVADTVLVGGDRKRKISKLTDKVTRNIDAEKKTQINSINVYDSDFGTVNIILDRYVPDANILGLSIDHFQTSYLRRFKQTPLAKVSDSTRIAIIGELTLDARTQKAGGKITAGDAG